MFSLPVTVFGVEVLTLVGWVWMEIGTVTVSVAVPPWPSLTRTWKVSEVAPDLFGM